ncbi:hypothetical protein JW711_02955 [Candidatus Woesearchaeota archaeon]|nr:hypothetical protein [Candidatus Woesearchaeota archaeon]
MRTSKDERKAMERQEWAANMNYVLGPSDKRHDHTPEPGPVAEPFSKRAPTPPAEHSPHIGYWMLAIVFLSLVSMSIMYATGGDLITGFAVKQAGESLTDAIATSAYTEKIIELDNITSLRVSGTVEGIGARMTLRVGNQTLLVGVVNESEGTTTHYTLTTDKKTYEPGETVEITTTPRDENTSVYVHFNDEATIVSDSYTPEEPGDYQVVRLINTEDDIIRLEIGFFVDNSENPTANESENSTTNDNATTANHAEEQEIASYTPKATKTFQDLCMETCDLGNETGVSRPTLIIEPIDSSHITITEIKTTILVDNQPPMQAKTIPNITIKKGVERYIELSQYFYDPDDNTLHYDITELENVSASIIGNELALYTDQDVDEEARIYATDGDEMISSNKFHILIGEYEETTTAEENESSSNESSNDEIQLQSGLAEPAGNQSPETLVLTGTNPCDAPPKERPSICFEGEEDKYLKDIVAPLQDRKSSTVGRVTRFGNLVISGRVYENSAGTPGKDDFKIEYDTTIDYEDISTTTAWIDGKSGDLYLRGQVFQEQSDLEAPQYGAYRITNNLGITLAYFDKATGNLYLRGNLVQLGEV